MNSPGWNKQSLRKVIQDPAQGFLFSSVSGSTFLPAPSIAQKVGEAAHGFDAILFPAKGSEAHISLA